MRLLDHTPYTLQGATRITLQVDGRGAHVRYSNSVNDEAGRRLTLVTPTGRAQLRVDWSPPYCGPVGRSELVLDLTDG